MVETNAWLLSINAKQKIAVAEYQMYEYILSADTAKVPLTPPHCQQMLFWQDRLIPKISLGLFFENKTDGDKSYVVVAYQTAPEAPIQYAGLPIIEAPIRIIVQDETATELPDAFNKNLRSAILSCFLYEDQPVPVLNITALCSKEFWQQVV